MTRGDIYLVKKPGTSDPKRRRAFVVVSRQVLIDSKYATVICAPVYSTNSGLSSQVTVGTDEALKHSSAVHCDGLVSIAKSELTDYVGSLDDRKLAELSAALKVALAIEE
ncbi:MAG: type II toxin-antitoxin system PemK/MazF family toxin [Spirochaetes bacterium]|jgi:mRNA interferase MazF|nr:type II toxin-antitoxin system PemK/MazF family toxin [Spirochaetota bacterium]